jgi:hypothetical protein
MIFVLFFIVFSIGERIHFSVVPLQVHNLFAVHEDEPGPSPSGHLSFYTAKPLSLRLVTVPYSCTYLPVAGLY